MTVLPNPPLRSSIHGAALRKRLLVFPAEVGGQRDGSDSLLPCLLLGSAVSCSVALDSLAESVGHSTAVVSAVAVMLDSSDLLRASSDKAVSVLATFASSDAGCLFLAQESGTIVPHLYHMLESGSASAEQACVAL